jgi:hypothetical protein
MKPASVPLAAFVRAIKAAQSGATALVPPICVLVPSTTTL